jgi:hypothetical protein
VLQYIFRFVGQEGVAAMPETDRQSRSFAQVGIVMNQSGWDAGGAAVFLLAFSEGQGG